MSKVFPESFHKQKFTMRAITQVALIQETAAL